MTTKSNHKFWFGVLVGALGSAIATQVLRGKSEMPNRKTWGQLIASDRGPVQAAIFIARAAAQYEALMIQRPTLESRVLRLHLETNILPTLALYRVFLEESIDSATALKNTDQLLENWLRTSPPLWFKLNQLLSLFPLNFAVFRRYTRWLMRFIFPSPAWDTTYITDNNSSLAFNIHQCFYLDMLRYYQAPELTPVFCKADDIMMESLPAEIRWARTQTLGQGADHCNFCWQHQP
ncbi:MAG: L-2-amino-thiazoline-4-carboxylic acid hydrolase [Chloroflexota bacterium]